MRSMAPHGACLPLALLTTLVALAAAAAGAAALEWRRSADATWAAGCDFVGGDIGSATVPGDRCSGACGGTRGCTHFAWTPYAGGTCWLKGGAASAAAAAVASATPGAVCGVMAVAPVVVTTADARVAARPYVPIFRFDDAAGDYCFPDDKRQRATRDGTCAPFRRDAPVFVSTWTCGGHTVYQFSLWYGQQRGCVTKGAGGAHGNDNEYVQVWVVTATRAVARVRFNQHDGFYFRAAAGVEMVGTRPVVYIGKIAHGAYAAGCKHRFLRSEGSCAGGCGYWSDFRNTAVGRYVLDGATVEHDPSPRAVECGAPDCGFANPDRRGAVANAIHPACSDAFWDFNKLFGNIFG